MGVVVPIAPKGLAKFPTATCVACAQRTQCQGEGVKSGRTIQVHPREALLKKLRASGKTPEGREALRERVAIEHQLAHVTARQGPRARYFGARKNAYDLRRAAVVDNLFAIQREIGIDYDVDAVAA